jgi:hypothetical protein
MCKWNFEVQFKRNENQEMNTQRISNKAFQPRITQRLIGYIRQKFVGKSYK